MCTHHIPKGTLPYSQLSHGIGSPSDTHKIEYKNLDNPIHEYDLYELDTIECMHFKSQQLVATYIQNWPWDDLLRDTDGLTVGMVLWLAKFVYGGIHAAALNVHFPSVTEKWLWRASSSYIRFCGGLWVVLTYPVAAYPR